MKLCGVCTFWEYVKKKKKNQSQRKKSQLVFSLTPKVSIKDNLTGVDSSNVL